MEYLSYKASEVLTLKSEAEDKIRKDSKIEIAKKLIMRGFDNLTIADVTDLTIEETEELRNLLTKK